MNRTTAVLLSLFLFGAASASLNKQPIVVAAPELSYYQVSTKMVACDVQDDAEDLATALDSGTVEDRAKFEANPRSCFSLNAGAGVIVENASSNSGVVRALINGREVIYVPLSVIQMQTLVASH